MELQNTDEKITHLEEKLLHQSESGEKIDVLNELSWIIGYNNLNKASEYSAEALRLSQKINYRHGRACAMFHTGVFHYWLSSGEDYLKDILAALDIFEEEQSFAEQVKALNILASIYDNYGDYEKAISLCRRCIDIAGTHGLDSGKADCLTALGQIYFRLGDYDLATRNLEEGLNLRMQHNEHLAVGSSLNLLARVYLLQKKYTRSEEYYNKSLALRTKINDFKGLPWTYLGLASLHEEKKEYDPALALYAKGIEMNRHSLEKRYDMICLSGIGNIQVKTGNVQAGIATLEQALQLASGLKSKPIMYNIHKELAIAYETIKNTDQSVYHYKQYINLKEDVLNTDTRNKLKNQQIAFAVEKESQRKKKYFSSGMWN